MEFLVAHEGGLRLAAFAGVLALFALLERAFPRRTRREATLARWWPNLALVAIDSLMLRFLFPVLAVGVALAAEEAGFGLLPWLGLGGWAGLVVAVILLDFVVYAQHAAFHHVPVLWRMHRVHHADLDVDVTTGVRFHPLEIAVSMLIKLSAVAVIGAGAAAVVVFEVLLNATAMFNHANLKLPRALDRALRLVVVTPDMHRVHHSVHRDETDSNFGFNLSCWDRLFGSYRARPRDGHPEMMIGLPDHRDQARQGLGWVLLFPFLGAGARR